MAASSSRTDPVQAAADLSLAERAAMTAGRNGWATPAHPAAGLGELTMMDGPLGIVSKSMDEREISTLLPSATALAASWDPELVYQVAQVVGAQARDSKTHVLLGPNLGLPLSPLSGRSFEMYSEDPWLTGIFASAFVSGVQSQGVGSCIKHLAGNDTESKRQLMNAVMSEKTLREFSLLPFEMAVTAGAWMAMAAYNKVNGIPSVEQSHVLGIVKNEWGFDGVIVSDWFATKRTAETANAGVDLEMPGPARFLGAAVATAVTAGKVPEARLTDMAARFIRLADRVGLLTESGLPPVARPDVAETLRRAVAGGAVLLSNRSGILPLQVAADTRIAVIGPNAAVPCYQGGTFARVTIDPELPTPLQALQKEFAHADLRYAPGSIVEGISGLANLGATAPDGTAGVLVEYFTATDPERPAHSEVRPGSSFVWFNDIPGIGGPSEPGIVRLTATVTADITGDYRFCVGGTGDATLTLDGDLLVRWKGPELSDIMGTVARADTTGAAVQLEAGQSVQLVAEAVFTPGRVQSITTGYYAPTPADLIGTATSVAAAADIVILIVGDNTSSSRESADRENTGLGAAQVELIERVAAANPRTVVVVNASRAVDMPWADQVAAVLMVWYPGQEFGTGLADLLSGQRAPGGRLPITIAARDQDYAGHGVTLDEDYNLDYEKIVPGGYGHLQRTGRDPRYPFGFGLSYTSFDWEAAQIEQDAAGVSVTVTVHNTGTRPGREVVQCYVRQPGAEHSRLIGFAAADIEPGGSASLAVNLPRRVFARWDDHAAGWAVPGGTHTLEVGSSVEAIRSMQTVDW